MRQLKGFTLVELMVSMALGLLISLAATQLLVSNQVVFNVQRGTGDVQAGGRFAIDMLVRDLRASGMSGGVDVAVSGLVLSLSDLGGTGTNITNANLLTRNSAETAGISASDQVLVQFFTDIATEDCEGNAVAKERYVIARYFIRTDADNSSMALACDGASRVGSVTTGLGDDGAVIVSDVDSFQVLLGLDDGKNGVATAVRYVNAATYQALATKPAVVAVRLGILVHSQESVGATMAPTSAVRVLDDAAIATTNPALADGRMRRLFISTVALRNLDAERI